jgi:colanic acid/amylovoran biosynthesis protein
MRVLVLWAGRSSANLGVRVLGEGMAALAKRAWGDDIEVDFQDYGPGDSSMGFGGRTIIRDIGRPSGPIKRKLREYDLVLDSGAGDSFADIYGLKRLATMNYAHRVASSTGVPLVLGPQTIGPFSTPVGRYLAKDSLRRVAAALPRDSESKRFAGTISHRATTLATDVVFALPRPRRSSQHDVLVNVSGLLWNTDQHGESAKYRSEVNTLIDGLIGTGRQVTLIAHVLDNPTTDNDVTAVRQVAQHFGRSVDVVVPHDLAGARQTIGGSKLVIGSRMHACLNAISTGVVAIPWAYSRKFAPLFSDIGWKFGFDLRTDADPAAMTLSLLERETESSLKSDLASVGRDADRRLEAGVVALRAAFEGSVSTERIRGSK